MIYPCTLSYQVMCSPNQNNVPSLLQWLCKCLPNYRMIWYLLRWCVYQREGETTCHSWDPSNNKPKASNQFPIDKLESHPPFFLFEKLFQSYVTTREKRLSQLLCHVDFQFWEATYRWEWGGLSTLPGKTSNSLQKHSKAAFSHLQIERNREWERGKGEECLSQARLFFCSQANIYMYKSRLITARCGFARL